ncbi:hypothetical protein [Embleya scabrispora]|uniref:hypothetical protein n=1 Tax=Embleya scabrispora TaxID=159449 RepID=UPI00037BCABD|nr:hypothetical protein [Embleya scabrispora]MYS87906.1 hypothetical protein [Streptomyces sp. SID5474]
MIETRILTEILQATEKWDDWGSLGLIDDDEPCGVHVAVMVEPFLGYILKGRKTIESRFSKPLIAPHQRIAEGDVVLLKAGPVRASFRASSVEFLELDDTERARLARDSSDAICADEAFWQARENKQYATLIGISEVRHLTPIRISKNDRRRWLVLREAAHDSRQLSLL